MSKNGLVSPNAGVHPIFEFQTPNSHPAKRVCLKSHIYTFPKPVITPSPITKTFECDAINPSSIRQRESKQRLRLRPGTPVRIRIFDDFIPSGGMF